MSSISNQTLKNEKLPPQQSDITIGPDGSIHISFLWDDLRDISERVNDYTDYKVSDRVSDRADDRPNDRVNDVELISSTSLENFGLLKWSAPKSDFSSAENALKNSVQAYQSCQLCPKKCGFDRLNKRHPTCGDFHLRVATFGISHGDEPEIRGTRGSGAVMLSGCPLKCPSCHNPEKVSDGVETSAQDFIGLCSSLYEKGAHNIQILSPTVHLPALRSVLQSLKRGGFPLPFIFKSSGYENIDQLKAFEGLVDIYLPDFKFGQCSQWSKRAGVKDYFATASAAVEEMIRQVGPLVCDDNGVAIRGVLVRHVEAPLPAEEKQQIRNFLNQLPKGVRVSYQDHFVMLE